MHPNFRGQEGAAGGDCDETGSNLGTEDGPSASQVPSGRGVWRESTFEQAQQEVVQPQMDLDKIMQEALLSVMPVPQVSVSPVKTVEALTGIIGNMWNPDARQPPDHLIQAIQESKAIPQTSSGNLAALDAEQDADLWDRRRRSQADGGLRAPGGQQAEPTRARKATVERTPPPLKARTAEPRAAWQGDDQAAQVQRLSARAVQNLKNTELLALSQRACAHIPVSASS